MGHLSTLSCLVELGCSFPNLSATYKQYSDPQTWIKWVLEEGPQIRPIFKQLLGQENSEQVQSCQPWLA